ncbi:MAG: hypothetical protein HY840_01320 [Bacteroidetes bacterium]|nr:hypothetical protein [Bacteroidota bacterium]
MNIFFLKTMRNIYIKLFRPTISFYNQKRYYNDKEILEGSKANEIIKNILVKGAPAMIARFGDSELYCLRHYLAYRETSWKNKLDYIKGGDPVFWDDKSRKPIFYNAGVFPHSEKMFIAFSEEFKSHLPNIDVLASWLHGEEFFYKNYFPTADLVSIFAYEPYFHENPWSKYLAGKKVLVIHPFEKSIQVQYKKRNLLFKDPNILPDFELITYKAVQSIAGNKTQFKDWIEALKFMVNDISKIEFDIAIIGAGAYGLPLTSYVKQMGKIGIHLGGATQILFGIWGSRYDEPRKEAYLKLKNEHWIRPSEEERPIGYQTIEGGCYW